MDNLLELWSRLDDNRPVQAGLIVVGALVLAKLIDVIVHRTVRRWVLRSDNSFDDKLCDLLHGPVIKTVLLLGLGQATRRLMFSSIVEGRTLHALWTIGLFVWGAFVHRFVREFLQSVRDDPRRVNFVESRTLPLFENLSKIVLMGLVVYGVIMIWDIDATGWLASAGIVGIAVGFAAKDTLANLFAGVFVIADAPYRVGDFIVLGSGERGQVVSIGLRSTRVLTRDDIEITIPNAIIGTSMVTNETGGRFSKRRVRTAVQVAYGSDIDQVREVLMEVAASVEHICESPEPRVRFRTFGESGLNFELLGWIERPVYRGRSVDALNTAIYKRFNEVGIEFPFPQRDLYVKEMPGS